MSIGTMSFFALLIAAFPFLFVDAQATSQRVPPRAPVRPVRLLLSEAAS